MQADQANCLKPLEIWDFGLALASRQRLPVIFLINPALLLDFFIIFK